MTKKGDYPNGMTVIELKEIIKAWPEQDIYGEPTEVWIGTGRNLSSPVKRILPLNSRMKDGIEWADFLSESDAFED